MNSVSPGTCGKAPFEKNKRADHAAASPGQHAPDFEPTQIAGARGDDMRD